MSDKKEKIKIGDLVRFRMAGGLEVDYSPVALIIERFPIPNEPVWVALCSGLRCVIDEVSHDIEVICESRGFSKIR